MINSLLSGIAPDQSALTRLSTNLTQSVSKTAFSDVAAQVSAASKNESLDTAFKVTLSDEAKNILLQLAQQGDEARPASDDIFAQLDADGDGLLSEAEFVEGRPNFASQEQAEAKFAELDADASGTLTQAEAEAGAVSPNAQAGAGAPPPPPPPPPAAGGGSALLSELLDELDTDESGVVELDELMAGLEEAAQEAASGKADEPTVGASADDAEQSLTAAFLSQLNQAIQSYVSADDQQAQPQLLATA
jgi:Ca2+-binding EF-hand superfamily protein